MKRSSDSQPATGDVTPDGAISDSRGTRESVGGDKISTGNISDSKAVAIGAGAIALVQSFGAEPEEPVPFNTLLLYLQKASEGARQVGQEPAIKQLYEMPMRVRLMGSANTAATDLFETVQSLLRDDQRDLCLQRVVIQGDAGAGKSVALGKLRSAQARQSISAYGQSGNEDDAVLPILISLSYLQTGVSLMELIAEALNHVLGGTIDGQNMARISVGHVDQLLQDYKCLLLLDGLEDVPTQGEMQLLRRFMEAYPKHNFVFTCSTSAYRRQLGSALPLLAIDDLNGEEVRAILKIGNRHLNPALMPLVHNRMHMETVLSTDGPLAQVRSKGQLLRMRYGEAFRSDPANRGPQAVNRDMLELIVENLAYTMLRERTLSLSEYELMEHIQDHIDRWHEPYNWRQVADQLQSGTGLLVRDELRRWAFRDKTMLASFAASASLQIPLDELLARDVNAYLWQETLALLIGLLPDETELCYRLIDQDVFAAALCVRESGRDVKPGIIDAIIDVLVERLSFGSSEQRRHVVLQLGASGHPRAIDGLLRIFQREWSSYVMSGIVRAVAVWLQQDPTRNLADQAALKELDEATAQVLLLCISELKPTDEPTDNLQIYQSVINDPESSTRARGLAALGLGLMRNPAGLDVLIDLFKKPSSNQSLSWHVVEALTDHNNKRVIQAIKDVYNEPQPADTYTGSSSRRAQAIYLSGWLENNAEMADILWQALGDTEANTRGRAVEAIGRLDLLNGRESIEEILIKDTDPFVVRMAAEALGAIGDLTSIPKLVQRLNSETALTRWAVQQAIREIRERQNM